MPTVSAGLVGPALRTLWLRARHPRLRGGGFVIHRGGSLCIDRGAVMRVGASSQILRDSTITVQGALIIGRNVFINRGVYISVREGLTIGDGTHIGVPLRIVSPGAIPDDL